MSAELVTMPDLDPYLTPQMAGWAVARSEDTIWTWQRRLRVASICDVKTGELRVRMSDVYERAQAAEKRQGRPEHAHRRRKKKATRAVAA